MKQSKSGSNQMDLLHGPLLKKIFLFAIPLALSSLLQQLFNVADIAVVGQFAGKEAMAAVGADSPVIALFVTLFVGLSVGANVIIARYIGEGREDKIRDALQTSVAVGIISGFIVMAFGIIFAKPIHHLMSTPDDVFSQAVLYLVIYCAFAPFIMLYNFGAAILRSAGDTKRPLYSLAAGGVLNIFLNLLLVIVFHLGVAGVAIATGVSNVVSSCMVLYFLCKEKGALHLDLKHLYIRKSDLTVILRIGIPAGLQSTLFSISNVVIQSSVNSFGAACIAGNTACLNFDNTAYFVMVAFNQTCMTFISQNYGAKNMDRCRKTLKQTFLSCFVIIAVFNLTVAAAATPLSYLFSSDPEVVAYSVERIRTVSVLQWMVVTYELTSSAMRGLGYSTLPTVIIVFGTVVFRLFWVFVVFASHHTYFWLNIVYPLTWVITGTAMCITCFIIFKVAAKKIES